MTERRVRTVGRPSYGRPQPLRSRRSRGPRWNLGLIPQRFLLLLAGVIVLTFVLRQFFDIKTIEVKSASRSGDIQTEAQKLLGANWWQGNLLTFDNAALAAGLLQADPMLKTVTVHRRWPRGLSLDVTLKQPSLGWSSDNQAYLLDRDGSAIGSLPAGSSLPVVADDSNLPVSLGQRVTTTRFVAFVTGLNQALPGLALGQLRYEVKDTTLDLYVSTGKGYQVIFDTSRDANQEVSDLRTLLTFLSHQGKTPSQYIDLRIAGKAYYK